MLPCLANGVAQFHLAPLMALSHSRCDNPPPPPASCLSIIQGTTAASCSPTPF